LYNSKATVVMAAKEHMQAAPLILARPKGRHRIVFCSHSAYIAYFRTTNIKTLSISK
jgi:hypothetical protein